VQEEVALFANLFSSFELQHLKIVLLAAAGRCAVHLIPACVPLLSFSLMSGHNWFGEISLFLEYCRLGCDLRAALMCFKFCKTHLVVRFLLN
jgi:hypothetical protein